MSRPSMYFLEGNDADWGESGWTRFTDIKGFFSGIPVNVVLPIGGPGSFYTDWQREDPQLGRPGWETFLTKELPPLVDEHFSGNGRNGIVGLSAGGRAAITLAVRSPQLYSAVGSFSGPLCGGDAGQDIIRVAVGRKGGDADNMWGQRGDPAWIANDPNEHVDRFRGKAVYLSAGSGVPRPDDAGVGVADLVTATAFERIVHDCTKRFESALSNAGIPAAVRYTPEGIHSWPLWCEALHDSWSTLRIGLGI